MYYLPILLVACYPGYSWDTRSLQVRYLADTAKDIPSLLSGYRILPAESQKPAPTNITDILWLGIVPKASVCEYCCGSAEATK
jgi:hypothetical protein